MANLRHVEIVKQGTEAIANWNLQHPNSSLNLKNAYLSHIELEKADFRGADLEDAVLYKAQMTEANFEGANLARASLCRCTLELANLHGANLTAADFSGADIFDANIMEADLDSATFCAAIIMGCDLVGSSLEGTLFSDVLFEGTDLSNSFMGSTVFADCDLRGAIGLETARHAYPSTIGIDTILRSEGNIPPKFLRGCGLPDHLIEFVDSIAKKPIQYYSCFISHGEPDAEIAKHLFDKLQDVGVRCWYFPETARTGERVWGEINRAIRLYEKLVIICSRDSLQREGVLREIREGLQWEKQEKLRHLKDEERVAHGKLEYQEFAKQTYRTQVLFPITIDDYIYDEWTSPLKKELTDRVVGDFRRWDNLKEFDKHFEKLLKDLTTRS